MSVRTSPRFSLLKQPDSELPTEKEDEFSIQSNCSESESSEMYRYWVQEPQRTAQRNFRKKLELNSLFKTFKGKRDLYSPRTEEHKCNITDSFRLRIESLLGEGDYLIPELTPCLRFLSGEKPILGKTQMANAGNQKPKTKPRFRRKSDISSWSGGTSKLESKTVFFTFENPELKAQALCCAALKETNSKPQLIHKKRASVTTDARNMIRQVMIARSFTIPTKNKTVILEKLKQPIQVGGQKGQEDARKSPGSKEQKKFLIREKVQSPRDALKATSPKDGMKFNHFFKDKESPIKLPAEDEKSKSPNTKEKSPERKEHLPMAKDNLNSIAEEGPQRKYSAPGKKPSPLQPKAFLIKRQISPVNSPLSSSRHQSPSLHFNLDSSRKRIPSQNVFNLAGEKKEDISNNPLKKHQRQITLGEKSSVGGKTLLKKGSLQLKLSPRTFREYDQTPRTEKMISPRSSSGVLVSAGYSLQDRRNTCATPDTNNSNKTKKKKKKVQSKNFQKGTKLFELRLQITKTIYQQTKPKAEVH